MIIQEEEDPDLIREDNNIIYNLLIEFPTACLGGEVEVPIIDGVMKVKIPAGTQPNTLQRFPGKGLPSLNSYGKGELIINISIYVPETLNDSEKIIMKSLLEHENFRTNVSILEKFKRNLKNLFYRYIFSNQLWFF